MENFSYGWLAGIVTIFFSGFIIAALANSAAEEARRHITNAEQCSYIMQPVE